MGAHTLGLTISGSLLALSLSGCVPVHDARAEPPQIPTQQMIINEQPAEIPQAGTPQIAAATKDMSLEEHVFDEFHVPAREYLDPDEHIEDLKLENIYIVAQKTGEKCASNTHKKIVRGEEVWLYAVVEARHKGKEVYFTEAEHVRLNGRQLPQSKLKKWPFAENLFVEWNKVEADSNGKWYKQKYLRAEFPCPTGERSCIKVDYQNTAWKDGWKVKADVHPTLLDDQFNEASDPLGKIESGLGVMRYAVAVQYAGKRTSSPDASSIKNWRDLRKITEVTIRNNDGMWTDFLFEAFNTPYIWGSSPQQVDTRQGSDCADLAVYGRRRAGRHNTYTYSKGLLSNRITEKIAEISGHTKVRPGKYLDEDGEKIPFSTKVLPGDVLFFDGYPSHIGVLYKDNGNGYLDKDDLMIHTSMREPQIERIRDASLPLSTVVRFR